jgi:rRNA maturation RNase YbeY
MNRLDHSSVEVRVHVDDSEDPPESNYLDIDTVIELARTVIVEEGRTVGELDIVFCGDNKISELNRQWFDRDVPTDVIAFNLSEEAADSNSLEGELYIDLHQAERQAPHFDVSLDEEIRRLVIHGVLHLVGYTDTGNSEEAEHMLKRQEYYVANWTRPVLGGEH